MNAGQILVAAWLVFSAGPLAAQTVPCAPPPAAFPFAPRTDVPMLLQVRTERPVSGGGTQNFGLTFRLKFAEAGRGFRLTSTLVALDRPDAGKAGAAMTELLTPLVGRPMDFLLSADGRSLMLHDGETLWAAIEQDLLAQSNQSPVAEGKQMAQLLLQLPTGSREQLLAADIRQMLRFANAPLSPQMSAAGGANAGNCGSVEVVDNKPPTPESSARHRQRWRVDRATGLVVEQFEEQWIEPNVGEPPRQLAETRRTLTPEN